MSKVPVKIILDDTMQKKYAVSAFAVNNMEQIQSIVEAARICRSPLIIMISTKSLKYSRYIPYLMDAAIRENPDMPIAMHLDHGVSFEQCREAIDFGFSSVMIDGTFNEEGRPSGYDYNLKLTKKVADYAHKYGVTVEGEIGFIGGKEDDIDIKGNKFTDPKIVKEFVESTGIDSLAVSIGNSHGLNKFDGEQKLRFDILAEIHERIPEIPLVLHGASSLPDQYIRKITKYGGDLRKTKGVPIEQIKKAIKLGIRKVNIYSDITLCMIAEIRKFLFERPEVTDPREYLGVCQAEITRLAINKFTEFGSVNKI
ncbi:MAG: class II fructose-bisphosphate aldolase [Candidatus Humimicrobiaceae bacterium]